MTWFHFLASLPFAADLDALAHRDYHVRAAAHRRLAAADWLAYPALARAATDPHPERRHRVACLLARLPTPAEVLAVVILRDRPAWAADAMARYPEVMALVCGQIDRRGLFLSTHPAEAWIRRTPYHKGSLRGDAQYVLDSLRGPDPLFRVPKE